MDLTDGQDHVVVDSVAGGRIASIRAGDRELLVTGTGGDDPLSWGCYPMVPWAGRVRRGRFSFGGAEHSLEINLAPHSIHGTGFTQPWTERADGSIDVSLGDGWPFGGTARQRFALANGALTCTLEAHAEDRPMPAQVGWHPWFLKPTELRFTAAAMYARDDDGIPSGALVDPPEGPWDDCFTAAGAPIELVYDDMLVTVSSSCDHWVVYDQPLHATCVEPQSGPPDGFTLAPQILAPGSSLVHTMTITWMRR